MVIFKFCCCVQGLSTVPRAPLGDFVLILQGFCHPLSASGLCVRDRVARAWYEALEGSPNTAKITLWRLFLYSSCEQRQQKHTCLMNGSFCLVYSAVETPWSDSLCIQQKREKKKRNGKACKCEKLLLETQKC